MSLSLYMDQNVEGPITSGLRLRGVNVITALEDGTDQVDDEDLMDRATALGIMVASECRLVSPR